ncbi:MAG TPA: DUF4430 domain-containing protein [Clostridiales bacterium]|nr:DUF4430 domain-containing protein [Clostridiales bacterium]
MQHHFLRKTIPWIFLMIMAVATLTGCATTSTEKANQYLDKGDGSTAESGNGSGACTVKIECVTVTENMDLLASAKREILPADGIILETTTCSFDEGDTVLDVLLAVTKEHKIQMEYEDSPAYGGGYVEGIANLYEFDCGELSGWEYFVNDWSPNYGCANYRVGAGDVIEWRYTCDNGEDLK